MKNSLNRENINQKKKNCGSCTANHLKLKHFYITKAGYEKQT